MKLTSSILFIEITEIKIKQLKIKRAKIYIHENQIQLINSHEISFTVLGQLPPIKTAPRIIIPWTIAPEDNCP